jgi:predicted DNA-binding transcriptional regulator AlpA
MKPSTALSSQSASESQEPATPHSLLDKKATCAFFGGSRPINPVTLYRGMEAGRYPKPIRVGPNSTRWLRSECEAALKKMIEARDSEAEPEGASEHYR